MGSITYYVDGFPVTVSDRTYSFDETVSPVNPAAYKVNGDGSSVFDLWRTQPALRMVTTFIASNIASIPMHAFSRQADGDRERLDPSAPLSRLLRSPDKPRLTWFELMHTLVLDVCLEDRYAAQVFAQPDGTYQLVRMPTETWKFDRDATGRPKRIQAFRKDGSDFTVPLDRALWIDGYPSDKNTSPIESLRGILREADEAAKYRMELWTNGGRMPGWISRPLGAKWTQQARETWRGGWQKYASGGVRAGGTPLLEDGMEYHELGNGITPENGQQLESRQFTIAEVSNAFHIPPQMVGQDAGSSYNSVTGYQQLMNTGAFGSWVQRLNDAFNMRLVPQLADEDRVYVELNVAAKLRMAFEEQANIFQTTTGGPVMTVAEARKRLNLPFIPGTDVLLMPLNMGGTGEGDDSPGGGTAEAKAARSLTVAETVQKVYLGVDKVISSDEARQIVNEAGGQLQIPGPDFTEEDSNA